MQTTLPNYVLIGSGRLASHLRYYLSLYENDIRLRHWARNPDSGFNSISCKEVPDHQERLEQILEDANVVLLAIGDNALEEWINKPELKDKKIVHFSGARYFKNAWGFHPLMTFSTHLYEVDFYRKIPFVADPGFPHHEIFSFLPNPFYTIEPEKKPLYHALCHMAANFPALLWVHVFRQFDSELEMPHAILKPMLEKILSNTFEYGPQALAGPLRRGDLKTIELHDHALESHPALQSIYDTWTEWALSFGKPGQSVLPNKEITQ